MSINFESHKLDRRSFLKGAGVIGAARLLSACGGSSSNNGTANSAASGTAAPNTTGGALWRCGACAARWEPFRSSCR